MNIKDYIYLNQIPSGNTQEHNHSILEYFGVEYNEMKVLEVYDKVKELTKITINKDIQGKLKVNGKWYYVDRDITKSTFGQFIELESYLSDDSYLINHFNELLAIFVRPRKWNWWKFRYGIEKWDPNKKDVISNALLEMDINDAFGLNVFFYQNAANSINNMKVRYLVELEKMRKQVPN